MLYEMRREEHASRVVLKSGVEIFDCDHDKEEGYKKQQGVLRETEEPLPIEFHKNISLSHSKEGFGLSEDFRQKSQLFRRSNMK